MSSSFAYKSEVKECTLGLLTSRMEDAMYLILGKSLQNSRCMSCSVPVFWNILRQLSSEMKRMSTNGSMDFIVVRAVSSSQRFAW